MTISNTFRRAGPYIGNGSQSVFPFSFKVFSESDVHVVRTTSAVDVTLTLNSDYTVNLNADQDNNPGGSIILSSPLTSTEKLTMISHRGYTQNLELTNRGGFYPQVINDAFDHVVILVQQLLEISLRGLKVAVSSDSSVDTTLPVGAPNQLIGWDDNSQKLINFDPGFITEEWHNSVKGASREEAKEYLVERGFGVDSDLNGVVANEITSQLSAYGVTPSSSLSSLVNSHASNYLQSRGFGSNSTLSGVVQGEVQSQLNSYGISGSGTLGDLVNALAANYLNGRGFGTNSNLTTLIQAQTLAYLNQQGIDESVPLVNLITAKVQELTADITTPTWLTLEGKPEEFNPQAHTHAISEITSLQSSLDSKAALTVVIRQTTTIPTSKTQGEVMYSRTMRTLLMWQTVGTLSCYASNELGNIVPGTTTSARPNELDLIGGTVSKTTYRVLWAWAQANNRVVSAGDWTEKRFQFADVNSSTFRLPDLRGLHLRFLGTETLQNIGDYQKGTLTVINKHDSTSSLTSYSSTGLFTEHSLGMDVLPLTEHAKYTGVQIAHNSPAGRHLLESSSFYVGTVRVPAIAVAPRIIAF